MMGEPRDKSTVEIDKSDEGLHLLLVSQSGPVCYTSNLDRIYFDLVVQDDNSQILNLSLLELTLLRSKIKVALMHSVQNKLSKH
jgi:hypothetical protein